MFVNHFTMCYSHFVMLFSYEKIVSSRYRSLNLHLVTRTYYLIVLLFYLVGCTFYLVLLKRHLKAVFYSILFSIRILFIRLLSFICVLLHFIHAISNNSGIVTRFPETFNKAKTQINVNPACYQNYMRQKQASRTVH